MKKILFTDLDGTLLNNRSQIDEEMKLGIESRCLDFISLYIPTNDHIA